MNRLDAARGGWPLVGSRADGFGGGRMHGVKPPAFHAFEQDQMSARVGDGDRNRDAGFLGLGNGGRHHLFGAVRRQALAARDIHLSRNSP